MSAPRAEESNERPDWAAARREDHRCARNKKCADREKIEEADISDCECDCHGHGLDHPCDTEGGCGHLHKVTKRWAGAEITTEQGMCLMCTSHLAQAVRHLPGDYVELTTLLGTRGAGDGTNVRFSRDLPIPLRLAVKSVQEAIVDEVSTWLPPVTEAAGMEWLSTTEERHSRPQYRVLRASRILVNAVSVLLDLPPQEISAWTRDGLPQWDDTFDCQDTTELDGIDGGLRLLRLHELTKIVAGRSELTHYMPAPCPACQKMTLVRDDGTTEVICRACRVMWKEIEYERLCLVLASDERRKIEACEQCDKNGQLPDRKVCKHEPVEVAA